MPTIDTKTPLPLNVKASHLRQMESRVATFVAQGRRRQDALDQADDANISTITFCFGDKGGALGMI